MASPPTFQGRVLVADDNPVNRVAIEALLQRLGLEVTVVSSGEEALVALAERPYSLCLLDLNMPSLNGVETSREIRSREKAEGQRRVPVVAISGELEEEAKEECLRAGMDDWLGKPFKLDRLCEVLEKWIPDRREENSGDPSSGVKTAAAPPEKGGESLQRLDPGRVTELRALPGREAADHFTELVAIYLPSSRKIMDDLKRLLSEGDSAALRAAAHELRSSTLNMGGERLAALCGQLEVLAGRDFEAAAPLVREVEDELSALHAALAGQRTNGTRKGEEGE